MARVFIDSFESQNLNLWDELNGASIQPTAGLDMKGGYCVKSINEMLRFIDITTEFYFSFRWRNYSDTNHSIVTIKDADISVVGIRYNTGKVLVAYVGTSSVKTSDSLTVNIDTTYFIQVYIKVANSGGRIVVKVDGDLYIDYTGDTQYLSYVVDRVGFSRGYYDNIIMDDSELPEETEIVLIKPNGTGYYSDWESSSGGANYTCIDEVPYNDSDYVASGIVNAIDTYTLESLPSNTKSIKCIQAHVRGRKESDSPISRFNFVIREGGTVDDSDTFLLVDSFDHYYNMYTVNPINSEAWHPPNVNAMEIGIKSRT